MRDSLFSCLALFCVIIIFFYLILILYDFAKTKQELNNIIYGFTKYKRI